MKSNKRKKDPTPDLDLMIPLLIGIWRRFHKEAGPPDQLQTREFRRVVGSIRALMEGLQPDGELIGTDYFKEPSLLTSYLLYQWIIHYLQGMSLLGELPRPPRRVLDLCSGPAPFAFAALKHGAQEVVAIDQNEAALRLGAEACGRSGYPLTVRTSNCLKERLPVEGTFDLIILGHCLEELFPASSAGWIERQQQFIEQLFKRLSPDGFLLIVENSQLETNRRILRLRDACVEKGVPIQAPCVWRGACPALRTKDSPCYAQRECENPFFIKEIQRALKINLSSLKMSYLIFRHPEAEWPVLPKEPLYRVVSPPIETYHGNRFYLCGTDGKKTLGSHLQEPSKAFKFLKRGELISVTGGLEQEHSIDLVSGAVLSIEAACGKPLPEVLK